MVNLLLHAWLRGVYDLNFLAQTKVKEVGAVSEKFAKTSFLKLYIFKK